MYWTTNSTILVQGITTSLATHYTQKMLAWGTKIVAGVSVGQGKGEIAGVPIFDLVEEAIATVGQINTSVIFVNPYEVLDAALEAIAAGIKQLIIVSKGVPPLDMIQLLQRAREHQVLVIGPGSAGIIMPGQIALGISEAGFYQPGRIAILSRTASLSQEVATELNQVGLGQSIVVNLGWEAIIGSDFQQWLEILAQDHNTEGIVVLGRLGGSAESAIVSYVNEQFPKPVVAYLTGVFAPVPKFFEDAATIIANQLSYSVSTNNSKEFLKNFQKSNILLAQRPSEIPSLLQKKL